MMRLSTADAEREFARILDDAIRVGERADGRISNASVGDDCGVDPKRVRQWRDPNEPRHMPAGKLLQVSDEIYRGIRSGLDIARARLRGGFVALATEAQAGIVLGTVGELVTKVAALLDGAEAHEIRPARAAIAAVRRDLDRLDAQLAARESAHAEAEQ